MKKAILCSLWLLLLWVLALGLCLTGTLVTFFNQSTQDAYLIAGGMLLLFLAGGWFLPRRLRPQEGSALALLSGGFALAFGALGLLGASGQSDFLTLFFQLPLTYPGACLLAPFSGGLDGVSHELAVVLGAAALFGAFCLACFLRSRSPAGKS